MHPRSLDFFCFAPERNQTNPLQTIAVATLMPWEIGRLWLVCVRNMSTLTLCARGYVLYQNAGNRAPVGCSNGGCYYPNEFGLPSRSGRKSAMW